MIRLFTKNSTGVAPDGRWFSGDVNAIQDAVAAILDYTQTIGTGFLAIGESGLQLLRFGAGEARLTGHLRIDGILRGLSGLLAGSYTTTARDAIAAGQRPPTMVIYNSTTARYEYNAGSDAAPNWLPLSPPIVADSITAVELAPNAVTATELAANAVTSAKIQDGTIVDADLAADTLTARVIAADSIGTSELAPNAVTTAEIADGTIATGDLGDGVVTSLKIADGSIVDGDVSAGAALALSKLATIPVIGQSNVGWRIQQVSSTSGVTGPRSVTFPVAMSSAPWILPAMSPGSATGPDSTLPTSQGGGGFTWPNGGASGNNYYWVVLGQV